MAQPASRHERRAAVPAGGFRDYLALEAGHSPLTVEISPGPEPDGAVCGLKNVRAPGRSPRVSSRFHLRLEGPRPRAGHDPAPGVRHHTYYRFLLGESAVEDDPSDRLETPRRSRTLPDVLSLKEVRRCSVRPRPMNRSRGGTAPCSSWPTGRASRLRVVRALGE
jgi:hypothetical protein